MLRRAGISLLVSILAALWGFSGVFPKTGSYGQALFLLASAFFLLSALFSLFEERAESGADDPASAAISQDDP
jgi:uncharacterized membrane protein YtjA (UPF0391 family)